MASDPGGSHYFTRPAPAGFRVREGTLRFRKTRYAWATGPGVFSRGGLDRGTALLIESLDLEPGERILDLGCGNGAVGILVHQVFEGVMSVMSDVSAAALACARVNVRLAPTERTLVVAGDGYGPFAPAIFDVIALNPPIRAGRATVAPMISQAPHYLAARGRLFLVGRVRQGVRTLARLVESAFGHPPELVARGSGYRVFCARKDAAAEGGR